MAMFAFLLAASLSGSLSLETTQLSHSTESGHEVAKKVVEIALHDDKPDEFTAIDAMRADLCLKRFTVDHDDCIKWLVKECTGKYKGSDVCHKLNAHVKEHCIKGNEDACDVARQLGMDPSGWDRAKAAKGAKGADGAAEDGSSKGSSKGSNGGDGADGAGKDGAKGGAGADGKGKADAGAHGNAGAGAAGKDSDGDKAKGKVKGGADVGAGKAKAKSTSSSSKSNGDGESGAATRPEKQEIKGGRASRSKDRGGGRQHGGGGSRRRGGGGKHKPEESGTLASGVPSLAYVMAAGIIAILAPL